MGPRKKPFLPMASDLLVKSFVVEQEGLSMVLLSDYLASLLPHNTRLDMWGKSFVESLLRRLCGESHSRQNHSVMHGSDRSLLACDIAYLHAPGECLDYQFGQHV